ncbi:MULTISPECIES: hypothetical protein [Staphylococcus]|jgi:membrane-bound ClpP family serine protease|uniref:Mid2-like cell wall stress sensor domain protein n=2 Tax=Staphylococcus cohnii TaxID=29382 RepID=A0ABT6J0M0_9STAP|nr:MULTISPECIES: hypothetical protein [Staphylococcus]KKI63876.1 hypothetical protein UF66_0365 [Staphylococcus cohnii subsp. cohnii]MCI2940549.1 hypothetical protein [Staphylococcus cohnii]MDE1710136.1 hypothetical protein [Staphylococcus cohnii]MDH5140279.1 hypothetical protein [Staphylococcus cohnii]MDH5158295.1 hypothetical protein [Staphylococcus cohnii]
MWIVSILLIIVGIVLLIINKRTPKNEGVGKKQSLVSFGVVCLIIGIFGFIGQIIRSII